jgi:CubicO group peptidase (beta-lactamase class C family)
MKRLLSLIISTMICFTAATAQDLEGYVSQFHKALYPEAVAPGIAVVVVKDSRVILLKGFGYADIEAKRP